MKDKLKKILPVIDFFLMPLVFFAALLLKFIRRLKIKNFPYSKKIFFAVGVFPIQDHYYEPLFHPRHLRKPLHSKRRLSGIDWNVQEQLALLSAFKFQEEFKEMPDNFVSETQFYFNNGFFQGGDAEYWYSLIRLKKPKTIIEIGSGHSTLMARLAIERNMRANPSYACNHISIEPYEAPHLDKLGLQVYRKRVEDMDIDFFQKLEANDILFIDSSHIIRPQGDVLFEHLEIIPTLKSGVIVHIHDIFSPRDYPDEWILEDVRFWNEQYLLESFLSFNRDFKIIGALNFLKHNYFDALKEKCPKLMPDSEPGSFYIEKR